VRAQFVLFFDWGFFMSVRYARRPRQGLRGTDL
jgi:hypothetical protein